MKLGPVFVATTLLLAALIGGHLTVEAQPILNGLWAALASEGQVPALSNLLVAAPITLCFAAMLCLRRTIQSLHWKMAAVSFALLATLAVSLVFSEFRYSSGLALAEFTLAICTMFAAIGLSGRINGPRIACWGLALGCTLVALKGISEYGRMRQIDPSWRIFADWINQNALAGMLLLGFCVTLGLAASRERRQAFAACLCAALIGLALILTQSKGGLIAAALGAATVFCLLAAWTRPRSLVAPVASIVLAAGLGFGISKANSVQGGTGPLARVANAGATSEQSAGFRKLLWQGALANIQQNPLGTGLGVYRYSSSKSGYTPQTHLAHNSYLQLAAETSPLALLLFVGLLLMWFAKVLRAPTALNLEQNSLRAGIVGAIVGALAHNVVDSDLYHFGIAVIFFCLLGLGLQLAADGTGPELAPNTYRIGAACLLYLIPLTALGIYASDQVKKGTLLTSVVRGSGTDLAAQLEGLNSSDPDTYALRARYNADRASALDDFLMAAKLAPSGRNLRALAQANLLAGKTASAAEALNRHLLFDPNNLLTLKALMKLYAESGEPERAKQVALRLLDVEKKPYFTVRAIPELIPTETYDARLYLASTEADLASRARLIEEAIEGFKKYKDVTIPRLRQAYDPNDPTSNFAGETLGDANQKFAVAEAAAKELARVYRQLGDEAAAARTEEVRASFSSTGD